MLNLFNGANIKLNQIGYDVGDDFKKNIYKVLNAHDTSLE
jgi:hypothetical protein